MINQPRRDGLFTRLPVRVHHAQFWIPGCYEGSEPGKQTFMLFDGHDLRASKAAELASYVANHG